ncbi:MAG TPA: hypothetical protein VK145_02405 [Candidatus Nanoarchaeia archaeon]|nr:hypothetical protein [Candidatus Nanoarchaeia archaeon]
MNNKFIIGVLIGLVITIGGFIIFQTMNNQPITAEQAQVVAEEKIKKDSPTLNWVYSHAEEKADGWIFHFTDPNQTADPAVPNRDETYQTTSKVFVNKSTGDVVYPYNR